MKLGALIIGITVLLFWSAPTSAASFDCAKAKTKIEHMICTTPELSKLDNGLSKLYRNARNIEFDASDEVRAQRAWMKSRDSCEHAVCLSRLYKERIDALRSRLITRVSAPSEADLNRFCLALQTKHSSTFDFRSDEAFQFDVDNNGSVDSVSAGVEGTAHHQTQIYIDEQNQEFELDDSATFLERTTASWWRPVRYEGRSYSVYYSNWQTMTLDLVSYTGPERRSVMACRFSPRYKQKTASRQRLCADLLKSSPAYLPFKPLSESVGGLSDELRALGFNESYAIQKGLVDINNDGQPESIMTLQHSSSVGYGCEHSFFHLANDKGDALVNNSLNKRLLELQGAEPNERHPTPFCDQNSTGWFHYRGDVYFESRMSSYPSKIAYKPWHIVGRIKNGVVEKNCDYSFDLVYGKPTIFPLSN